MSSNAKSKNKSGSLAKIPSLKQETIMHYSAFVKRIKELETLTASMTPKPSIFVIFSGNYTSGPNGKSWCGLCNAVYDFVNREIVWSYAEPGYLLWVRVGDQEEWTDPDNPFRKDPKINIKSIPAAIKWGTEKKLEGFHMAIGVP
ncbi:unnamed protein product [Allacma fusca]|uniref:Thioredoxin domain-containing protein n=1 Tax=Allacma fusca TaxID=39272 RepID=A0A8J2MFI5_9HEXA|nr:unnamed protein product [Allacma fusca]